METSIQPTLPGSRITVKFGLSAEMEHTTARYCISLIKISAFQINQCDEYAYCGKDAVGNMDCVCDQGFRGDGYNCTDINECVEDPSSCSQDKGQGVCINTPGSYNCTCADFYTGRDCQDYRPRRHCADLYHYWGFTQDGVYAINPAYSVNGLPPFSDITVYCDMTTREFPNQTSY